MDRVIVRNATPDDRRAIERLSQDLPGVWQSSWRKDVVARALGSSDDLAFVAVRNGAILGFACAHDVGFRGYLSELAVADSQQRRGVGAALVRAVQDALLARGYTVVIADIHPPAERFYRTLGWSEPKAKLLGCRLEGGRPNTRADRRQPTAVGKRAGR
jgi:ribosomal protein S18 acetylase RimI-like enzyme